MERDMLSEELVKEICIAHREWCRKREEAENKKSFSFCGGMTISNMPNKCRDCPYFSDWACILKFADAYVKGEFPPNDSEEKES